MNSWHEIAAALDSWQGVVAVTLFLIFGPPAILSKGAAEKLNGLGAPARAFQAWKQRRAEAEIAAFDGRFNDMAKEIEILKSQVTRLQGVVDTLNESETQMFNYIVYTQKWVRNLQAWAAAAGIEFPPPPFESFQQWVGKTD